MTAAQKLLLISESDYLSGELVSSVKHEYLGGYVHAMAGAGNQHNRIATNATVAIGTRLRGRRCRPFNSDTKIRVRLPTHVRYYYPDLSVVCRMNSPGDSFQDDPAVIVEVLSNSTRRLDMGEKRDAYLTIPSLQVYILLEQESALAIVYRRTEQGFIQEQYRGSDTLRLPEIEAELPLAEVYEGVEFIPEPRPDSLAE